MPKKPVAKTKKKLASKSEKLMPIARKIAKRGECQSFTQVCELMEQNGQGGFSLKLRATAQERAEIDLLCHKVRELFLDR